MEHYAYEKTFISAAAAVWLCDNVPDDTLMQKSIKQRLKINKAPSESHHRSVCGGISGLLPATCSVSVCTQREAPHSGLGG